MDSAEHVNQVLNLEQLSADFRLFGEKLDYIAEELKKRPTLPETASLIDLKISVSEVKMGGRLSTLENRMGSWEELGNRIGTSVENTMAGFTDKITRLATENEAITAHIKEISALAQTAVEVAQKAMDGTKQLGHTLGDEIKRLASIVESWSGIQQATQSQLNSTRNETTANSSSIRNLTEMQADTDQRVGDVFKQFGKFGDTLSTFDGRIRNMESRQESIFIFVSNLDEREKARVERNKRIIQYIRSLRGMTAISVSSAPFLISLAQTLGVNDRAEEFIWILEQFFSHF